MISIFTRTARSLCRTVDNMATPCSVKAYGAYRLPPRPLFEVANCDLKEATHRPQGKPCGREAAPWRISRPVTKTTSDTSQTQSMQENGRILRLVLSNSVWKDDRLEPAYKKPFDFLAENNQMAKQKKAASRTKNGLFENWLPGRDSNPRPIG